MIMSTYSSNVVCNTSYRIEQIVRLFSIAALFATTIILPNYHITCFQTTYSIKRKPSTTPSPRDGKNPWHYQNRQFQQHPSLSRNVELHFFGRLGKGGKNNIDNETDENNEQRIEETTTTTTTTQTATISSPTIEGKEMKSNTTEKTMSPEEIAAKLRADADKERLEAERMDAELTLRKISRLERELENAKKHPERTNQEMTEQLQREMDALQAKIRGDVPKPVIMPQPERTSSSLTTKYNSGRTDSDSFGNSGRSRSISTIEKPSTLGMITPDKKGPYYEGKLRTIAEPFDQANFDKTLETVQNAPTFLKKSLAIANNVAVYDDLDPPVNVTELAIKVDLANRLDFSFSTKPVPKFTSEEIEERKKDLLEIEKSFFWNIDKTFMHPILTKARTNPGLAKDNATEFALMVLEYEYYMQDYDFSLDEVIDNIGEVEEWMQPVLKALNASAVDSTIDALYPKCTRKEGKVPSMAQVQIFITDILPKASFTVASKKPEQVLGGYIIRGKTRLTGDDFITKIDSLIENSAQLKGKLTVLYTTDFTVFADSPEEVDLDELEPILYITGADIVCEPRLFQLSTVSAMGIATVWYLSLYPFLLNSAIAARVDEQIALSDANMTPDLAFLTDLSFPLFTTFIAVQLIHELGHLFVAGSNNIKTSVPTFVPSIITGITSSVTTFKTPPKNKAAMFDFSLSGPLAGIIASMAAIVLGTQLTVVSPDQSLFPALPLEILRQSTLGGGIINAILGNGALSVPEGAIGTAAVAGMTVPLHPVAIAGFISLVVNSLALLPIGTTDGGRMGLALFGRGAKLLVGNFFLFAILFVGLVGSDLFLFYFAFCIAFQSGNEIPARNEVDKLDIPRAVLASAAYFLAVLALVPFQ